MRIGIHYDTGISPGGRNSRTMFDPSQVAVDMHAIAQELHCDAVRIAGGDAERLTMAADLAAAAGLNEIWFSPMPCELDEREMFAFFEDCAARAEALSRHAGCKVVLVLGCEVSVFARGFLPGDDAYQRMQQLSAPSPEMFAEYPARLRRLNAFLAQAAEISRARFHGPVTYAAGPWEQIDWTPFNLVGIDAYRNEANRAELEGQLDSLVIPGKPLAVTEFGCCTYRGAAARGANGWAIVEKHGEDRQLDGIYERDEQEQVRYLRELLETYERHHIDVAFWFTFAGWNRPHRKDPRKDLDMSSFGVVKVADERSEQWSPKAVFHELARIMRERQG